MVGRCPSRSSRATRDRRASDLPVRRAFYTLADELHETILVLCSKCEWQTAFSAMT
jgi:hypothetical protein